MATTKKINKTCCDDFLGQLQTLGGVLGPETERVRQVAIETTNCPVMTG